MSEEIIVKERDEVIVRFSGDSGDGMQLAGNIFSDGVMIGEKSFTLEA